MLILLTKGGESKLSWEVLGDATHIPALQAWRIAQLRIRATGGQAPVDVATAITGDALEIPEALLTEESGRLRLRNKDEIAEDLKSLRDELIRRHSRIELTWKRDAQGFFGLKRAYGDGGASPAVELSGYARIYMARIMGPDTVAEPLAELGLLCRVSGTVLSNTHTATLGTVVILKKAPSLRLDLDDLGFGLPDFPLPTFDLPKITTLTTDFKIGGVAKAFEHLLREFPIEVAVVEESTSTALLLKLDATPPTWTLVKANQQTALQTFTVSVKVKGSGDTIFVLSGVKAGFVNGTLTIEASTATVAKRGISDGSRRLGPLHVSWKDVFVTPTFNNTGGTAPLGLSALVSFARLTISAADDPNTVIAVGGEVLVTPSGATVQSLRLVEPYPIKLLADGYQAVERLAAGVLRFLASLDPSTPADQLKKVLEVLGRICAAAARAARFAGEVIGDLLVGIARVIGDLLHAVAALAQRAGAFVDVEIRLTIDPLELRQIVITLRDTSQGSGPIAISVAGIRMDIAEGWQPSLLLDFATQPGAYLLVFQEGQSKTLATVSTDLWFTREKDKTTSPLRDASDKDGARAKDENGVDQPLVSVTVTAVDAGPKSVVLAGVSRGRPIFMQRVRTPAKLVSVGNSKKVVTYGDGFIFEPLTKEFVSVSVNFAEKRVLPLLGMGETGPKQGDTPFLEKLQESIGQVIWVEKTITSLNIEDGKIGVDVTVGIQVARLKTKTTLHLTLSLEDFSVRLLGDPQIDISSETVIRERALGLEWIITPSAEKHVFTLRFDGPESFLKLATGATMELRFVEVSADGDGLVFKVTGFHVGRGGVDITAPVENRAVRLNGLDVPFRFTSGGFVIKGSRLVEASVAGSGKLPPQLVGDASASIALVFTEDAGQIVLQSGTAEIDKAGQPIVAHLVRFTLTISRLELGIVRDGGVHFYFLLTGTLQFTPNVGEFEEGILKYFKNVRMQLERVPLAGDARVLAKHISFQVTLQPKLRFNLFELFTFELRGIGFHPSAAKFGGAPALNVSGQISFVEIGDVMQPKIDFHGMWIAPPADGQALPRVRIDGLGVDIGLAGTAKLTGTVLAVDDGTPTLEGKDLAPPEYKSSGFLGEGRLSIEGFATLAASFGFLEVTVPNQPAERKKSFFLFLQQEQVAYEIPTPVWPLYIREVGFGFGFRYTLEGIKAAEQASSAAELIKVLDEVSKRQGDLASFTAWRPDPEKDNVTLALRAAVQVAPAEKTWNEKSEKGAENPFFFDLVAALRSDMTFLMSMRGWLSVNYLSFTQNTDGLRTKPMFRGYLYISAPRSELLARFIADPKGYIGQNPPLGEIIERALRSVQWSATLYIRPGLFHYELGWPDQLRVRLFDEANLRVDIRGGMIFRVWDSAFLHGYNVEADALLQFSGRAGGGSIGVSAEASLRAAFVARLLAYIDFRGGGALLYGLISLDCHLTLRVSAWLHIDLKFTSIDIDIHFALDIQISAAVELAVGSGGIGARVQARVAISVFGATLGIDLGFRVGDGELDRARARVKRFMAMSITAETPEPSKFEVAASGEKAIEVGGTQATQITLGKETSAETEKKSGPVKQAHLGVAIPATNFWLVLRKVTAPLPGVAVGSNDVCAVLIPRDGRFYAGGNLGHVVHTLHLPENLTFYYLDPATRRFVQHQSNASRTLPIRSNLTEVLGGNKDATLRKVLDECFLYDRPEKDITNYAEPPICRFRVEPLTAANERDGMIERDRAQRDYLALARREGEAVEGARSTRSTLLLQFIDQFTTLTDSGTIPEGIHIADVGLVFVINAAAVEAFARTEIGKSDQKDEQARGDIDIFNPVPLWFENGDPILRRSCSTVRVDGVKLNWDLAPAWTTSTVGEKDDPEHHLHYYEITRTVEGRDEDRCPTFRVKPVSTIGVASDRKTLTLHRADWQFTDDFVGLPEQLRRALLPLGGPDNAVTAAADWVAAFGNEAEITVTYMVTLVDVAGSRGCARPVVVKIARPASPVRPASAKLVVTVPRGAIETAAPNPLERPRGVRVDLAISDPHWNRDGADWAKPIAISGGRPREIARGYRLILDPEDIVPSGSYGTDALTDRMRGPGQNDTLQKTGDEIRFTWVRPKDFPNDKPVPNLELLKFSEAEMKALSSDDSATYPLWFKIAHEGSSVQTPKPDPPTVETGFDLAEALWRRVRQPGAKDTVRVGVRAYLETLIVFAPVDGQAPPPLESRRVPVSIELRVPARPKTQSEQARDGQTLTPDAFEWPVRVDYPPLASGGVRARAGLACFMAPSPDASLCDLLKTPSLVNSRVQPPLAVIRDPERQVLTEIEWDAGAVAASGRQTIAGYDVHELDLDDLARSDTSGKALETDLPAWRRARRTARVHLLRWSMATLTPERVDDPTSWRAHYPSETWRVMDKVYRVGTNKPIPQRTGSLPILRPWFSPREATLEWPATSQRIALFPTVDDLVVDAFFEFGTPKAIVVEYPLPLQTARTALSAAPTVRLAQRVMIALESGDEHNLAAGITKDDSKSSDGKLVIVRKDGADKDLSPSDVRCILMSLELVWPTEGPLELPSITLTGTRPDQHASTGTRTVLVEPTRLLHPVLHETLDRLAYHHTGNVLYRRYVVLTDQGQPLEVRDLPALFGKTDSVKDPYGWTALWALGLCVGFRLYDGDTGAFVDPGLLLKRAEVVFRDVCRRYHEAQLPLGVPVVDVMLRPGRDSVLTPFDAVKAASREPALDSEALAFAQLSLRPRPLQSFGYCAVSLHWETDSPGKTAVALLIRPPREAGGFVSILRPVDGRYVELEHVEDGTEPTALSFDVARQPQKGLHVFDLIIRFRGQVWSPLEAAELLSRITVQFNTDGKLEEKQGKDFLKASLNLLKDPQEAYEHAAESKWTFDVYGLFPEVPVATWERVFVETKETKQLPEERTLRAFAARAYALADKFSLPIELIDPSKKLTTDTVKPFIGAYLNWSQRFLDHGATSTHQLPSVAFALCAPIRQQPWRLSARHDGSVSISLLHQDRFAHARAYAVKPIGRYHELVVAAHGQASRVVVLGDKPGLEELVGGLVTGAKIGYAVAVSPRTAKLEPPVIVGTSRIDDTTSVPRPGEEWQLVVARHGEQDLIMSNRALFARLGFEGVALSFLRDYCAPDWPERLDQVYFNLRLAPNYGLVPPLQEPREDKTLDPITGADVQTLMKTYPSIWKGADTYQFRHLPHHLRVTVLAVARAGAVVSPIASATQNDFHYRLPEKLETRRTFVGGSTPKETPICRPNWSLVSTEGGVVLELRVHALSYADLMSPPTFDTWVTPGRDVAHWPDPDVIYVLVRHGRAGGVKVEEDEAEILSAPKTGVDSPYMLRARGPHLSPAKLDPVRLIYTEEELPAPRFTLVAHLHVSVRPESRQVPGGPIEAAVLEKFAKTVRRFAALLTPSRLSILLDKQATVAVIKERVLALRRRVDEVLAAGVAGNEVLLGVVIDDLKDRRLRFTAILDAIESGSASAIKKALDSWTDLLDRPIAWPETLSAATPEGFIRVVVNPDRAPVMRLFELPSDEEIADAVPGESEPEGAKRLFEILRSLVLEQVLNGGMGFHLRAVKGTAEAQRRDVGNARWVDFDDEEGTADGC